MNYLKKIRNLTIKLTEILFIKITKKKYWSEKITISSFLNGEIKLKYLSNKLGFISFFQKKIGRYHFDASLADTELCMIGKKFQTDKSPFNETMHRHPYTPIYHLLFNSLRFKRINLAEIGILNNSSIKMWREYFPKAKIFGFEFFDKFIENAKKDKLKNVFYKKINVCLNGNIKKTFKQCKLKFDIIIDDSTHTFDDQIRIIKETIGFIKPGGILVIEDIPVNNKKYSEELFHKNIKHLNKYFDFVNFFDCDHINKFSKGWNNDRLLILIRNDKNN
jgi:hypothetical protein